MNSTRFQFPSQLFPNAVNLIGNFTVAGTAAGVQTGSLANSNISAINRESTGNFIASMSQGFPENYPFHGELRVYVTGSNAGSFKANISSWDLTSQGGNVPNFRFRITSGTLEAPTDPGVFTLGISYDLTVRNG